MVRLHENAKSGSVQLPAAKEKGGATEKQPKQAKTSNACLKQPKQTITNDNNVIGVITSDNKPKQTITKITVTDTVTGTVTVPVNKKPPDGTAPDGAAPPASSMQPARK